VLGDFNSFNPDLGQSGRVADFMELCRTHGNRRTQPKRKSCGGHFRTEYQDNGEAKRDDQNYRYVAAWEYKGDGVRTAIT
jgi:succinate dehydrogenase / fumarate reductase flavoprotein subunit